MGGGGGAGGASRDGKHPEDTSVGSGGEDIDEDKNNNNNNNKSERPGQRFALVRDKTRRRTGWTPDDWGMLVLLSRGVGCRAHHLCGGFCRGG